MNGVVTSTSAYGRGIEFAPNVPPQIHLSVLKVDLYFWFEGRVQPTLTKPLYKREVAPAEQPCKRLSSTKFAGINFGFLVYEIFSGLLGQNSAINSEPLCLGGLS